MALDRWSKFDSALFSPARLAYLEIAIWDPVFHKALALQPKRTELWIARARYLLQCSRWAEARAAFEHVIPNRPAWEPWWYEYAAAQALTGDLEGYKKTCRKLQAEQAKSPNDFWRASILTRTCHLVPDSGIDSSGLIQVPFVGAGNPNQGWQLHIRGATFYRAAGAQSRTWLIAAISLFEASNRDKTWSYGHFLNGYYLAMAHHQLGHAEEARAWLNKANQHMDQLTAVLPGEAVDLFEVDWVEAPLLRQEAEKMLLAAKEKPKQGP